MEGVKGSLQMNTLPCGYCRIKYDDSLTILEANDFYYHMHGYTRTEASAVGFRSVAFVSYPPDWTMVKEYVRKKLDEKESWFQLETRNVRRSGEVICVLIGCKICTSNDSELEWVLMDITEERRRLEQLEESNEESRLLLRHAHQFAFRFDPVSCTAILPRDSANELGLNECINESPEELVRKGILAEESKDDFINFFQLIINGETQGTMAIRLRNKSGMFVWYRCAFFMIYDSAGASQYAVVSFEDITVQREKELAYEKWSHYNETQLKDAIVSYECNLSKNRIDRVDGPMAAEFPIDFCKTCDETLTYMSRHTVHSEDRDKYEVFFSRDAMRARYYEGKRELSLEYRKLDSNGNPFWALAIVQLLPDPYSKDIKAFFLIKNIDTEKRQAMELQKRLQMDTLTGLYNRRTFIEKITEILENSGSSDRHAFIMMDIDHFKLLNDRMGHQFGDRILKEMSGILRNSLRSGDIVGRLGGDEFVVCMRNMPLNDVLEKKMVSICSLLSKCFDTEVYVSGSLGVAIYPKDGVTFDELYWHADLALYEAKRLGRNRFVFYQEGMAQKNASVFLDAPGDKDCHDSSLTEVDENWFDEIVKNDFLKENQKEILKNYIDSIRGIFDDLIVLDVTRDYYHAVFRIQGKYLTPGEMGALHEIARRMAEELIHPEDETNFLQFINWSLVREKLRAGDRSIEREFRKKDVNGAYKWVSMTLVPMEVYNQDEVYLCFIRDIEARKNEEEAAIKRRLLLWQQMEDECYRRIIEETGTILLEYNGENDCYYASPAVKRFTLSTNIGKCRKYCFFREEDIYPEERAVAMKISESILQGSTSASGLVRLKQMDGSYLWCHIGLSVLRDEAEKIIRCMYTIDDVDEAIRNRKELEYRAEYDDLTGYYNFSKFKLKAARILKSLKGEKYSIWYCDLRNFKWINDMYGYDYGDGVLRFWADLIHEDIEKDEVFARISADHFTILRKYNGRRSELMQRFKKVSTQLTMYKASFQKKIPLELVCGVYCIECEEDILSVEDMIDRANLAQKSVKHLEGSQIAFYTIELQEKFLRERKMEAMMEQALARGEFQTYLQPVIDLTNGRIYGATALSRWIQPERGVVLPSEFNPIFEKNGFLVTLDFYIFTEVCRWLHRWLMEGGCSLKISIPVSRISLFQPDFVERYLTIKQKYEIPDGLIELECSERAMVQHFEKLDIVLQPLRAAGFSYAIDNFEAGYSSLHLLNDMNLDTLKLDMNLFRDKQNGAQRIRVILSSIVSMARELGIQTIAKGVETESQMSLLKEIGCHYAQGYLIGKPLPAAEFLMNLDQIDVGERG